MPAGAEAGSRPPLPGGTGRPAGRHGGTRGGYLLLDPGSMGAGVGGPSNPPAERIHGAGPIPHQPPGRRYLLPWATDPPGQWDGWGGMHNQ